MIPKILTTEEIATMLSVSEQRVRTLLRQEKIVGQLIGNQWIVTDDALAAYKDSDSNFSPPDRRRSATQLPAVKALSFFSGAMGLDLGLERAGIHVLLTCEFDKASRKTITANRPDVGMIGDIWKYTTNEIRDFAGLRSTDEIDIMVGGPPCQAFSTAGARKGFSDERGNAFLRYVDLVLEMQPRYAVIENVRGLLSAPMSHRPHAERNETWSPALNEQPGGALQHVLKLLRDGGYEVSFNLYNAANFGVPQVRERVILICTRNGGKVPHLIPTHTSCGELNLPVWRTLRDAIGETKSCNHVDFPENRLKFYRQLKSGQYWKHLPEAEQKEALGKSFYSGGGKTGFFRRLDWDKPSCTLVTTPNMPATDICHPSEDRPISIEEYKRIQQFPDDWQVCGSLKDQYKQIGNAVPVGLGEAVGRALISHMNGIVAKPPEKFLFSRYRDTDEVSWASAMHKVSTTTEKRTAASPKVDRPIQTTLFEIA